MPYPLMVKPHLPLEELVTRFRACGQVGEKERWRAVILWTEGRTAEDIADICKCRPDWARRTIRRYNEGGPDALVDRRGGSRGRALDDAGLHALDHAVLNETPPTGGLWTGAKVALWIEERTGNAVHPDTGLNYLHRLGFSKQTPRPRHPEANADAQDEFKKKGFKAVLEW